MPRLGVLVSYPLVYHIAHSEAKYLHPIDPTCVVFIGSLASSAMPFAEYFYEKGSPER